MFAVGGGAFLDLASGRVTVSARPAAEVGGVRKKRTARKNSCDKNLIKLRADGNLAARGAATHWRLSKDESGRLG